MYLSSSCHAISMDIPDSLSPPLPIVHCFWQVFRATSHIGTELLYVRAGFARPCKGVCRSTSLTSLSLLLQQCPACLVCLTLIVFVTSGRWPYSCCFVGCFSRTCSILLTAFSCSCCQASSLYVLLVSTWCIHIAVLMLQLLRRNCASFYQSGLTSIRPIAYR